MPDDFIDTVQEKHHDDDTAGKDYIECWKFTIPRKCIHLMDAKNKQIKKRNKTIKNLQDHDFMIKNGRRKNDDNY